MELNDQNLQAALNEIDELVDKILDKLIEVEAAYQAFLNAGAWIVLLQSSGIHRESLVAQSLRQATLSFTILSLSRLWDKAALPPRKGPRQRKIALPDLFERLNETVLDALLERAEARLQDPEDIPGYYDDLRTKCRQARSSIIVEHSYLFEFFHGRRDSSYGDQPKTNLASKIKRVRDKWISHNDIDFEPNDIDQIEFEISSFLRRTQNLFEKINFLIRGSNFQWDSISNPIKRDLQKMFLDNRDDPRP